MWSIHCLEGRWSSRGSDTVPPSRVPQLLPAGLQPSFSRIAASSGLYLLGICSLQIIFRNFRGMNPRLTTSAFMRSSEKRVADEFKRSHPCLGSACLFSGPGGSGRPVPTGGTPEAKGLHRLTHCSYRPCPFAATQSTMGESFRGGLPGPFRAFQAGGRTSRKQEGTMSRSFER